MQLEERSSATQRRQVVGRDKLTSSALTTTQKRVLALIADDLSNKEIASIMNVAFCTVKAHAAAIFSRLNVRNREEAKAFLRREVADQR